MIGLLRILLPASLLFLLFGTSCAPSPTPNTAPPPVLEVEKALLDSLKVYSAVMDKEISTVVALPSNYNDRSVNKYPVVFLLHGAYGSHLDWGQHAPLLELAAKHQFILICPDGDEFSWYLDSPVDSQFRYETFMADELIPWVDKNYRTYGKEAFRAICGLSMGGHGAFYLAFRHSDIWSACGGISGGMDLRPFPDNWELRERLGHPVDHQENWLMHSVVGQLGDLEAGELDIYFDCGEEDFFFEVNEALHDSLNRRGIPHTYKTRTGKHDWDYFAASLPHQLDFFEQHFAER